MGCLTTKASGSIASFISPTVTPIESARVYFSPTQLGEGTPSPENVREIVGRTSVELKQCGKNLFDGEVLNARFVNNTVGQPLQTESTGTWKISKNRMMVDGGSKLFCYTKYGELVNSTNRPYIIQTDENDNFITSNTGYLPPLTLNSNTRYIRLQVTGSVWGNYSPYFFTTTPPKTIPFSWKRLPDEYQEVEYIESNKNGEYIDTGFIGNMGVCVETKFNLLSVNGNPAIIGSRVGSNRFSFPVYYQGFDLAIAGDASIGTWNLQETYTASIVTNNNGSRMDIYGDNDYHVYKTVSSKVNNNLPLYIFRYNRDGNPDTINSSALRLYYLKIYDGGISDNLMVRYFIPCYRKSDNEIGMYDILSQTFYTNQGTGTFTKGDDVTSNVFSDEVYGGYVDLVKGELVQDIVYGQITSEWLSSRESGYIGYTSSITALDGASGVWVRNAFNSTARERKSGGIKASCNVFKVLMNSTGVSSSQNRTAFAVDSSITNVSDFISAVETLEQNGNGLYLAYELATPITHPLPDYLKTQLQTLKNENTFWSDADSVEIEYGLAETFDIQKAKRKIIMNQPHVETITGDAVSFTTDMKVPLKECKVSFMPVQEGSGDPSPSNVRNIVGWNGVIGGLPSEYQEVEWIGNSTGLPYINTGIIGKTGLKMTAKLLFTSVINDCCFVGSRSGNNRIYLLHCYPSKFCIGYGNFYSSSTIVQSNVIYDIETALYNGNQYMRVNDKTISNMTLDTDVDTNYPIYIFGMNNGGSIDYIGRGRVYKLQLYDNDVLVRNFIPCYRKSDNEIGMYDTVSKQFFTNQGTGTFEKGNDINNISIDVDWIDDAGTVYGGYVDLVSGELVDEYYSVPYTAWSVYKQNNGYICYKAVQPDHLGDWYCNVLNTYGSFSSNAMNKNIIQMHGSKPDLTGTLYMALDENVDISTVQVIYKRAVSVPITYQLTPEQILSLKGQNSLFVNTNGTIDVKYWTH